LSLNPDAMVKLTEGYPGAVPITLPVGTYPNQDVPVHTIGVAALLLANVDMSNAEVRRLLQNVYANIDFAKIGSPAGSKISIRRAHTGATIPMHPGAEAYFDEALK
jgi:TRAP transporter TAXI family solute receptor